MTTTSAFDLDLPTLDTAGLDRAAELEAIAAARRRHWLARTPLGFSISAYADAVAVLRDKRFHSALSMLTEIAGLETDTYLEQRLQSILSMEGEQHARLRRLVAPAFTPAAIDGLRPFMREVVSSLVAALPAEGACDLVETVCGPYPVPVICELLGAPKEDWKLFSDWATDIFRLFNQNLEVDLPVIERATDELDAYVRAMVDERRAQPSSDLLSALIAVEEEGDRLSTDELVMMAEAILMAGTDTTRNQLACSLALFADHPDQWALLAADPERAPRAVEESMRYLGAVRGTARFASVDIVYRDVLFPAGTLVSVSLAAANRDPQVWTDPDTVGLEVTRTTQQMTFGSGIHHCLGAALARAELQEALVVLARRLPRLRLAGPVTWKPSTFGIWGPAELPVHLSDAAA